MIFSNEPKRNIFIGEFSHFCDQQFWKKYVFHFLSQMKKKTFSLQNLVTFRPTFLEVFNLNNLELGSLFSVYGTVALLSYVYGGVISDRFQPKKLIAYSLFFTALGGIVLSTYPSYFILKILYGYWGFTTVFLFWGAMIKATRVWGGSDNQGKAFAFLDGGRGLVAASMGSLGVLIFSFFLTNDIDSSNLSERKEAFRYVILFSSMMVFLTGFLVLIYMEKNQDINEEGS